MSDVHSPDPVESLDEAQAPLSPEGFAALDPEARYARNRAAIQRVFPGFRRHLEKITTPKSSIIGSVAGGDINLDLGHTIFYPIDGVQFAENQLAQFRAVPGRFYMDPPGRPVILEQQQQHIIDALYKHTADMTVGTLPVHPTEDGGFLLVYGIGLGFHLPALIAETKVQHFIIIDEYIEFLYHALHLHDWVAILDGVHARGQTLRFVFGDDPQAVAAQVHWYMRGQGFGLLDGSYLFRHYASMVLDKAYQDFREKLPLLPISIGFFEDEMVMLDHCTRNLIRNDFYLLDDRPRLEKDLPAVIVGSGPSLDRSIELLKRIKDQVIIFSCGTGLLPLLKNGIRPDFHCELENGESSYNQVKNAYIANGNLDGITLIGSTTVFPAMPALFQERVLYFRDSVCSTGLWSPDRLGIYGTAPTCTNLGVRAAMLMCFRQIYLFGVDLGTRDAREHHSRHAIYHAEEDWKKGYESEPIRRMSIEMPGNFGGKAYTNQILHWARMMMAQGIEAYSFAKIYNCSDGVNIPGTLPKLPKSVRIDVPAQRKPVALARLKRELQYKRPGEMIPPEELDAIRETFAEFYSKLQEEVAAAQSENCPFIVFYRRMLPYLRERGDSRFQPVLRAVNIGMMMMSFQIGYYFVRRVSDDEQPGVMAVFLTALSQRLAAMAAEIDRHFAALADERAQNSSLTAIGE